jgi:putative lipoprotein (rSAM/lipoprotein system)
MDSAVDTPTARYVIQGKVVSETDARRVIPDLQVVISHAAPHPLSDTMFTKSDGTFAWEGAVSTFGKDLVFTVDVTDIDGEKNRLYAPYSLSISFSKDEVATDISKFIGEGRKEVFIKMKETIK